MDNKSTVYNGAKEWLYKYKINSVKAATFKRLETSLALLDTYKLAVVPLYKLTSDDLQEFINRLVKDKYSLSTIKKEYHLVTAFLKFAFEQAYIQKPLYLAVNLPKEETIYKPKRDVIAYNKFEQAALKKVLKKKDYIEYRLIEFVIETGLRAGEAIALTWDDVQWERKALCVNKTMLNPSAALYKQKVQHSAKSKTSNRTIPLSKRALEILEKLLEDRDEDCNFVFAKNGHQCRYGDLIDRTKTACDDANITYCGVHIFRHTFATNCFYKGCNVKVLSKLLGHATVAITYNTYIHLYGDALEEMRSVVE